MISFGKYLLEVSLCTGVVFVIYVLLLRGRTLFQLNRFYLLGGLVASLILPMISLPQDLANANAALSQLSLAKIETEYIPLNFQEAETSTAFGITSVLQIAYIIGVVVFALRFAFHVWTLFRLKRSSRQSTIHGVDLYVHDSSSVFSFYTFIFAPATVEPVVLRHEQVHVKQRHWIDNLFLELVGIAFWFNPLIPFYRRAVKAQHEYLADQGAVADQRDVSAYMLFLLNTTYSRNGLTVASHFGSNTIKNRIIMLTKNKTPRAHALLYLLIAPALAMLLFAFQDSSSARKPVQLAQFTLLTQNMPADAPIEMEKVKMTYMFGEKFNPVTNKMQTHTGMDFVSDAGVNVMAAADGIVIDATFDEVKGNYVVIKHSDQYITQYFHMRALTVKTGVTIRKGEVIGFVGSTGLSVKDHLHYEVLKDGKAVDPIKYMPKEFKEGC